MLDSNSFSPLWVQMGNVARVPGALFIAANYEE